ncbi:hypothetical protein PZH35_11210, partial [Veillonella atypica]|uniref:ATP-binding protein n=1 Tax=Veillonella atypica TaxID=39777 RepID=UPI0034E02B21|nr:hypothetical protein [Veillonella atypica]
YQVDALPFILDDILVRFDEYRQKSALELLAELGEQQQIWLFTCQQQVYYMGQAITGIDTHILQRAYISIPKNIDNKWLCIFITFGVHF